MPPIMSSGSVADGCKLMARSAMPGKSIKLCLVEIMALGVAVDLDALDPSSLAPRRISRTIPVLRCDNCHAYVPIRIFLHSLGQIVVCGNNP
jgi:hypothetical protein